MVDFVNFTSITGIILGSATAYTFGDLFLALLTLFIIFFVACVPFGIPLRYALLVYFPLLLVYLAFYNEFLVIGIVILLYMSYQVVKTLVR